LASRKKRFGEPDEHIANSKGDHLGFDILSFETNERERLIEVKTTRFGALTPFFASQNEVEVSETKENEYQLYRLFNFAGNQSFLSCPVHFAILVLLIRCSIRHCHAENYFSQLI